MIKLMRNNRGKYVLFFNQIWWISEESLRHGTLCHLIWKKVNFKRTICFQLDKIYCKGWNMKKMDLFHWIYESNLLKVFRMLIYSKQDLNFSKFPFDENLIPPVLLNELLDHRSFKRERWRKMRKEISRRIKEASEPEYRSIYMI